MDLVRSVLKPDAFAYLSCKAAKLIAIPWRRYSGETLPIQL